MKIQKFFSALMLIGAVAFAACDPIPEDPDGPGPGGKDTTSVVTGDTLTVAQAIAKQDNSTAYVKGVIVGWYSNHNNDKKVVFSADATADTTVIATNIVIADAVAETDQAKCVCVQLPAGALRSALNLKDHPENFHAATVLKGELTTYNTMAGLKNISEASLNGNPISTEIDVNSAIVATCAEAADAASKLAPGASSTEYYKVSGTVGSVATSAANLVSYGNINFTLQDETGAIGCYYINYLNNEKFTSADQILNPGDKVTVVSQLKNYEKNGNTTPELANGFLLSIEKGEVVSEVTTLSFADVYDLGSKLAAGVTTMEQYRTTGIISQVNTAADKLVGYGNCNFIITDPTGACTSTITCYYTNWLDNKPFTSVEDIPVAGDTVTVVGPLMNYNGTTVEFYKGYIESIKRGANTGENPGENPGTDVNLPEGTRDTINFAGNCFNLLTEEVIIMDTASYTLGDYTFLFDGSGNTSSGTKIMKDMFRMFKGTSLTITSTHSIKAIYFDTTASAANKYGADLLTCNVGSIAYDANYDGLWSAPADANTTSVVFGNTGQVRINQLIIIY